MPWSNLSTSLRKRLRPAHRRIAGSLSPRSRRLYLYLVGHGRVPRLRDPRTFSEKVNWRILHDRRPELSWTCDKLAMKDYASDLRQEAGLQVPQTLWSGDDLTSVVGQTFGRAWVLKPNHRSGLVHFGRADDSVDARTVASTRGWLRGDQSVLLGEWAYSQARRLYLIEEAIAGGEPLDDYKFFVFDGKAAIVQVDRGRFAETHVRNFYTADWEPIPVAQAARNGDPTGPPDTLPAMVHAAEVLGRPFDFIRVDLYSAAGEVWFGEVTPYPGGGVRRFRPRGIDAWLGGKWCLPRRIDVPQHGSGTRSEGRTVTTP